MGIEVHDRTKWNEEYDRKPGRLLGVLACDNCDIEFNRMLDIQLVKRDEEDPKHTTVESEMQLVEKLSILLTFDQVYPSGGMVYE